MALWFGSRFARAITFLRVALCLGHHFAAGGILLGGTLLGVALCSVWHFAWGVTLLGVTFFQMIGGTFVWVAL